MNDETRLVRVNKDLFDFFGARSEDGRKLTYEWGKPVDRVGGRLGAENIYEPTIRASEDAAHFCTCDRPFSHPPGSDIPVVELGS